jgi:hypothetical protein
MIIVEAARDINKRKDDAAEAHHCDYDAIVQTLGA